jgi:DNA-binding transcriptional MocR family regulator
MPALSARSLSVLLEGWRDDPSRPAYSALADRVRLLVLDGRIGLGVRLPAERDLASQLGVSRTTVTAAYGELRDAGYLRSIRGSGSVARMPLPASRATTDEAPGLLDFSKAVLPAAPSVAAAALTAAEKLPAYLGQSGFDPLGLPELRQAIADRYTARGLPTDGDEVMITIGAQHAIALLARTLVTRGDRVLVESPSYPHAMDALREAGGRLVGVNVTCDEGWDEAALEQSIQRTRPTVAYLMPDFHNPTGRSMPPDQRQRVIALAAAAGTTLIADETMAELVIDGDRSILPFAAYGDEATRPILIGSVDKSIWGGLRVGWIRAGRAVIQRLARARNSGDFGTPLLEQLVVTELLPQYEQILEARRHQLRVGRDQLVRSLSERMPEWTVPVPAGGLMCWVNLGSPVSSQLTLAARSEGLLLAAGPRFGIDGAFERFLRIPFSYPADKLDRAVDALAEAWAVVGRFPVAETGYLAAVV